jgi:proteic killer suppression protein
MIHTFSCRDTEALLKGDRVVRFQSIEKAAIRKLLLLDAAVALTDLKIPAGNQLKALKGNRQSFYSMRINDQWRLCFRWEKNMACDVHIVDYH